MATTTELAVELKDVRKTYRTGPIEVPALRGVSLQIAARGVYRGRRSVRFRQNNPAEYYRWTGPG